MDSLHVRSIEVRLGFSYITLKRIPGLIVVLDRTGLLNLDNPSRNRKRERSIAGLASIQWLRRCRGNKNRTLSTSRQATFPNMRLNAAA